MACFVVQYPNFFGCIEDLEPIAEAVHGAGALLVVVTDPVVQALLRTPGELGADIVVAEGQPFGNAPSFGGPVVGLFAARQKLVRKMPGRIVGATVDMEDRRGYVLTLQTREQQIRREKATSNICTNQGLNALAATVHLSLLGREGLREVAESSVQNAHYAWSKLQGRGRHHAAVSRHTLRTRVCHRDRGKFPVHSRARLRCRNLGRGLTEPVRVARGLRTACCSRSPRSGAATRSTAWSNSSRAEEDTHGQADLSRAVVHWRWWSETARAS